MKIDYSNLQYWVDTQLALPDFEAYSSAVAVVEEYRNETGIDLIKVRNDGTREIRGAKSTRAIIAPLVNRRPTMSGSTTYQSISDRDSAVEDMLGMFPSVVAEYAFSNGAVPADVQEMVVAKVLREHGIGGKLIESAVCEHMGWDEDQTIHGYDATFPDTDRPIEIKSETATKKSGGAFQGSADWAPGTAKRSSEDRVAAYDRDNTYVVILGRDPVNGKVVYMFGVDWNANRDILAKPMSVGSPRLRSSHWMQCKVDPLYISLERMFDNYVQRRNFKPDFAQWLINDVFQVSKEMNNFFADEFGIKPPVTKLATLSVAQKEVVNA